MFKALTTLVRNRDDDSPRAVAIPILTLALMVTIAFVDRATFEFLAILFIPGLCFVLFSYTFRTFQFTQNRYLMILACGYFWVGILEVWHAVLELQQDLMTSPAANQAAQLLFSARALEALALLLAPFGARIAKGGFTGASTGGVIRGLVGGARGGYFIATGLLALAVVVLVNWFEAVRIEDTGLADWSGHGEFGILLLLGLALVVLLRTKTIATQEREPIAVAIGLLLFAEICFMFWPSPDGHSVMGHLLNICALWLIVHVVIVENLERPYREMVFRERRFRKLFEGSPISIWIEDVTDVFRALAALRDEGVTDLADYLASRPHEVERFIGMVRVREVNPATVRLFGPDQSSGWYSELGNAFSDQLKDTFVSILLAMYSGERYFQARTTLQTERGETLSVVISLPLPQSLADAETVPVSILDLTGEVVAKGQAERANQGLSDAAFGAVTAIAATIEKRDPYTSGHQNRVATLAVAIARDLGWDDFKIQGLLLGATIHDIGKIYVPAEILNRPGKLGDAEFELIKSHAEVGAQIVDRTHFPWPIREMIYQHHERLDGSGYPQGLTGDQIVEEAQLIGVADVVEAITSHRPYRAALGLSVGIEEIERGRGIVYNADVVDACLRVVRNPDFDWDAAAQKLFAEIHTPARVGV